MANMANDGLTFNCHFGNYGCMETLRTWRKAKGLSAEAAGLKIGVSAVHWFRMESGTRAVAADKALVIEELTGISRHELRPDIFGEEPKKGRAA